MLHARHLLTFALVLSTALAGCVSENADDDRPAFTRVTVEPEEPADGPTWSPAPVTPPPTNTTPPANESTPPEEPASTPAPIIVERTRVYSGHWTAAVNGPEGDPVVLAGTREATLVNPAGFLSASAVISWATTQGTGHVTYTLWDADNNALLSGDASSSPVTLEFGVDDARLLHATRITVEPALMNASAEATWKAVFTFTMESPVESTEVWVATGEIVGGAAPQNTATGHDFTGRRAKAPATFASATVVLEWAGAASDVAPNGVVLRFLNESGAIIHEIAAATSPLNTAFDANDLRISRTHAVTVVPADGSAHVDTSWTATLSFRVLSTAAS